MYTLVVAQLFTLSACEIWTNIDSRWSYGYPGRYLGGWALSNGCCSQASECESLCQQQPECTSWTVNCESTNYASDNRCYCRHSRPTECVGGITHFGPTYPIGDVGGLQYIQGTDTEDNLRNNGNGWPLWVKWTDRLNEQHEIWLTDTSSTYTMYFPVATEINWNHGGGSDRTGLDAETKWARVQFRWVDSDWSNSHGIKVIVQGYRYDFDSIYANDWEKAVQGVALANDVTDIIVKLGELGIAISEAAAARSKAMSVSEHKMKREKAWIFVSNGGVKPAFVPLEPQNAMSQDRIISPMILLIFTYFIVGISFCGIGIFIGFKRQSTKRLDQDV